MIQAIENEVIDGVGRYETRVRKLAIKLTSLIVSCWVIVGSTALGILLPAYVAVKVMRVREPKITVSERVYQQNPRQVNYSKPSGIKVNLQSGLRTMTNTLNEARYFSESVKR